MSDLYALIGNPVKHSLSPIIHRCFAAETQQAIDFHLIEAPLDGFTDKVKHFIHTGGRGFNVTLPFKQAAYRLADHASDRAAAAGAANTIVVAADGRLYADNTDGAGLIADLHAHHCQLADTELLMIGAGGAARGVLPALWAHKPRSLTIANRTLSNATSLATDWPKHPIKVKALPDGLENTHWSAVINATSASLQQQLPPLPERMTVDLWAYDLVYARRPTPFMQWAQAHGADTVVDGTGMLVAQAAESFYLWRGVRPTLQTALAAVRQSMQSAAS